MRDRPLRNRRFPARMPIPTAVCPAWRTYRLSLLSLLALPMIGCASFLGPESFLSERQIETPSAERMTVCTGETCANRREIALTEQDRATLRAFFDGTAGDPAAEREAMKAAIVWLESRVGVDGKRPPTEELDKQNVKEVFWNYHSCVDDTANTTTFLLTLKQLGVLAQHEVEGQAYRGLILDGKVPHFTAVIREKESGEEYAVDTWLYTTGEPVIVKPLSDWLWSY